MPLVVEELRADERVVIAGSCVYVHGPVPASPRWDPPLHDEEGREEEQRPEEDMRPVLCPGPWKWSLSPTHSVTVMLQQGGDVRLARTTLGTLAETELEEIEELMQVLGEGAVDPNASW